MPRLPAQINLSGAFSFVNTPFLFVVSREFGKLPQQRDWQQPVSSNTTIGLTSDDDYELHRDLVITLHTYTTTTKMM